MGNNKKPEDKSRRWFLSLILSGNNDTSSAKSPDNAEKVKMLTPDGKLVEVDKNILDKAIKNQKATNKEILNWMKNPSKENS
ncbi:MAG: hypothetical protein WDO71_23430 [Bacteroidota bacterium]